MFVKSKNCSLIANQAYLLLWLCKVVKNCDQTDEAIVLYSQIEFVSLDALKTDNWLIVQKFMVEKFEQLPCKRFLQAFEFPHAFLPLILLREKRGKFQNPIKLLTRQLFWFSFSLGRLRRARKCDINVLSFIHISMLIISLE